MQVSSQSQQGAVCEADMFPNIGGTFIIAEAGVNHNGDLLIAKRLIEVAHAAGADAVKFQTWKPGEITGKFAVKVSYLEASTPEDESRYELSQRLCLPYDAFRELKEHAERVGILFMSTPDGFESLDFLVDTLQVSPIKVGSTEVTHLAFLEAVARKNRPIILSTGLSTMAEVREAVATIRAASASNLALLHCTSQYPAPDGEMNLRAINALAREFSCLVGLSDHSLGFEASLTAVALGARIVEKHFSLDRTMAGPDHHASLNPTELGAMVASIRRVERMLGDGVKRPTPSEIQNAVGIRRSVVALSSLGAGTVLKREMLGCKRPATGLPPKHLESLIGRTLLRSLQEDEPIAWADVE